MATSSVTHFKTIYIDLLRHGECVDGHCYRGSTDVELSDQGYRQMEQSLDHLLSRRSQVNAENHKLYENSDQHHHWQGVITSPLRRCAIFSERLAQQYSLSLHKETQLQEIHFGDWEGQAIDSVWDHQKENVEQWYQNPIQYPPPNGEALDVFAKRVMNGFWLSIEALCSELDTRVTDYEENTQHLLLVSHGGTMRIILSHCLSMPLVSIQQIAVPYACLSRIQIIINQQTNEKYCQLIAHNITGSV